jgi:diguanylate cyclase (GGDEF)-like protein/PAS domain S-box-containing protein
MGVPLRALIVEDSADDAELLLRELRRGGYDPKYERVETPEAMSDALARQEWDVVIADYNLPRFNAPAALAVLHESRLDLPFIIVSGSVGEDAAVKAMKAGVHDYIMKGNLKRLVPSIERELREAAVRRERRQAEERSRQSEERFRQLAENIAEVFWMTNPDKNEMLYVSPGYEKIWGRACDDLYERPIEWVEAIHPDDRNRATQSAMTNQIAGRYDEEYRIIRPDGSIRWIRDRAFPVKDATGRVYRVTGIAEDITDRKLAEDELRNAKEFSENLIQTANVIILGLDTEGNINIFNETAEEITGYTLAELKGKNWFEILVPKDRYPYAWEEFNRLVAGGMPRVFDNPILTKSGEERYIMWENNQVRVNGNILATISFGNDITERKRAEEALKESKERLSMAINAARMYTWDWDVQTDRIVVSGHHQDVYAADLPAPYSNFASLLEATHHEDRKKFEQAVERAIQGKAPYRADFRMVRPGGEIRWLETRGEVYRDKTGRAVRIIGITQDITERKRSEELIQHMAFYDTLTALPNRNNLYDRLRDAIRNDAGQGRPLSLLLMDLNHFKDINVTLGYGSGDLVLKEVGARLRSVLFEPDVVACFGGDVFAVLLPHLARVEDVSLVVKKIKDALHAPIMIEGLPIAIEASMGVALYPDHGVDPESLLQRADVAMYAAKRTGSSCMIYGPEHDQHSAAQLALMAELREAIERNHLTLHYQPTIDLNDGKVSGAEALVRWMHPQRGLILPDRFIGLAERTGLVHSLTQWVLQTAIQQCGAWKQAGLTMTLAVNLSARNLFDPNLPDRIAQLLRQHEVTADCLTVEITESAIMADPSRAVEILSKIHGLGIRISIDDFGVGYSSLSYLRKLPVDRLKVDKSFVINITQSEDDATIVRSTIELAHGLGLGVVAEGVESGDAYECLVEWGCDTAQGYFISKPLPIAEFADWLRESAWGSSDARRQSAPAVRPRAADPRRR